MTYNDYIGICHSIACLPAVPPLSSANNYVLTPFESEFFIWAIAKKCAEKGVTKTTINRIRAAL